MRKQRQTEILRPASLELDSWREIPNPPPKSRDRLWNSSESVTRMRLAPAIRPEHPVRWCRYLQCFRSDEGTHVYRSEIARAVLATSRELNRVAPNEPSHASEFGHRTWCAGNLRRLHGARNSGDRAGGVVALFPDSREVKILRPQARGRPLASGTSSRFHFRASINHLLAPPETDESPSHAVGRSGH
jgi:hypothetical protein